MKKAFSVALSAVIVAVMLFVPSNTLFAEDEACFIVSSHIISAGDEVDVTITVKNSPGIASAKLLVHYDGDLILDNITYNDELGGMCQEPNSLLSPVVLNWLSLEEISGDIVFATLHFATQAETSIGEKDISITFDPEDVCDFDENNVDFAVRPGYVEVSDCLHENTTDYMAVESTCVTHGHAAYTLCNDCGRVIAGDDTPFPLVAHTAGELKSGDTTHWYICTVCGEKSDEEEHIEGDWIIDLEPTIYAEGERHKECTVCGRLLKTEIMPNIHTPGDINGDGVANNLDVILLFQYLSGWDVTVNEAAVDVNGDMAENNLDLVTLFGYLTGKNLDIY